MQLHDRFGRLVRLGPNCISIDDPEEVLKIYGTGVNLKKVGSSDAVTQKRRQI